MIMENYGVGKFKSLVLGERLRQLRKEKGLKGPVALAKRMKDTYSVSGILRREAGKLKIDAAYLDAFSKALKLSDAEVKLLKTQARLGNLKAEQSWADIEQEYLYITANSTCIYNYRSSSLPLELQTDEYTYAVNSALGSENLDKRINRHIEMKQVLAQKKNADIKLLCPEWVLYIPYGSPRIMLDQMVCLHEYVDKPPFEFRILPNNIFPGVPIGRSYKIYDHNFCRSASRIAINTIEDRKRIELLEKDFHKLWELSIGGNASGYIIDKAILHYREMIKKMLGYPS